MQPTNSVLLIQSTARPTESSTRPPILATTPHIRTQQPREEQEWDSRRGWYLEAPLLRVLPDPVAKARNLKPQLRKQELETAFVQDSDSKKTSSSGLLLGGRNLLESGFTSEIAEGCYLLLAACCSLLAACCWVRRKHPKDPSRSTAALGSTRTGVGAWALGSGLGASAVNLEISRCYRSEDFGILAALGFGTKCVES